MFRGRAAGILAVVLVAACGGGSPYGTMAKPTGTVTDVEGNVYPTIIIGKQEWMVENLKTTQFADGTPIPNVTDGVTWFDLTSHAYAWYDNDIANKDLYGALYNWWVVDTTIICPEGWTVPSQDNWQALADSLGGTAVAGGRMKEAGTAHWQAPNTGATNQSGFAALPAGWRSLTGAFIEQGQVAMWWTSTPYLLTLDPEGVFWDASSRSTSSNGANARFQSGFSIRCRRSVN